MRNTNQDKTANDEMSGDWPIAKSVIQEIKTKITTKGHNILPIEGLAVLKRFQSNLVKSIFREIGVFGGAAKLNQDVFNSTDPEAVECFPPT